MIVLKLFHSFIQYIIYSIWFTHSEYIKNKINDHSLYTHYICHSLSQLQKNIQKIISTLKVLRCTYAYFWHKNENN